MQNFITLAQIDSAAQAVKEQISTLRKPIVGIILGSGLNDLADSVREAVRIPYGDLPNFPVSTVHGHA
ncbi:MAG: purine-nucleoside phosphorylase, partial [Chloroflexi bacterium]|nr:purine-nucleoside phosphorylase [Chloroflexota bacterium]